MTNSPECPPQVPLRLLQRWRDSSTIATLTTVALAIIAIAAAWFMMQQLASILRPFFVAVFLAYVLMPYHSRLRKHLGAPASIVVLASTTALALLALALIVYASILGLSDQLPQLQSRAASLIREVEELVGQATPLVAGLERRWTRHQRQAHRASDPCRLLGGGRRRRGVAGSLRRRRS